MRFHAQKSSTPDLSSMQASSDRSDDTKARVKEIGSTLIGRDGYKTPIRSLEAHASAHSGIPTPSLPRTRSANAPLTQFKTSHSFLGSRLSRSNHASSDTCDNALGFRAFGQDELGTDVSLSVPSRKLDALNEQPQQPPSI
jgi:hypothetical protein